MSDPIETAAEKNTKGEIIFEGAGGHCPGNGDFTIKAHDKGKGWNVDCGVVSLGSVKELEGDISQSPPGCPGRLPSNAGLPQEQKAEAVSH